MFSYFTAQIVGRRSVTTSSARRILKVGNSATKAEVTKAYREAALRTHPDHSKSDNAASEFLKVKNAYEHLRRTFSGEVNKELTVSDQIGEALKKNDLIFAERMMSSLKGGDEQLNGGDMENLIKLAGLSTEQTADFYKGTRSAFLTPSDEAACWNNLLKKIRREKPDASETMNEILHVLNIMDRELGVQPDLAVMEQLFQYFPR
jgi:hypothetical protein